VDHASGEGIGTVNAAVQVTGPVAQDGRRAFDELWEGATQRHCSNFYPPYRLWQLSCRDTKAKSDHVPEVERCYLPGRESTAFSMLRTAAYDEADQQAIAALAEAQESTDIVQTKFTLASVCILDYLLESFSARNALPSMQSSLEAVEQNGAQVRLLIDLEPVKGIEEGRCSGICPGIERRLTMSGEVKRLYRSRSKRWLAGVCGGLGTYFDLDPTLIRVLFILFALAVGGGILAYLILWLIIPLEPQATPVDPEAAARDEAEEAGAQE